MRQRSLTFHVLRWSFWGAVIIGGVVCWLVMIRMPGRSFRGAPPPLTAEEQKVRTELQTDVQKLGGEIGERNLDRYPQLLAAAAYIESELTRAGWKPRRDEFEVRGHKVWNIEAVLPGRLPDVVLIGAHYDSVVGAPGANDNGSGVAALLALARRAANRPNEHSLRFVAFVNEEPDYFQSGEMGSLVYARRCREHGDRIRAMISLETIGYYSQKTGSQSYPMLGLNLFYSRTGNFIGFVSNLASRGLLRDALGAFRRDADIPSAGGALPAWVRGVGWSDQWSFWQQGYPGIMVTDTAPCRYPYYHTAEDTPDKLDYDSTARVVSGLERVVRHLVQETR